MKKALIIIDMQNDYFAGGKMALVGIDEAMENSMKLIEAAKEKEYEIFFIQHIATRKEAGFFLPNSEGVKLHTRFDLSAGRVVQKYYPNSFRETSLHDKLQSKRINDLIICGAMSHMCVDSTVRAGFDLGYRVTVVEDACATRDLTFNGEVVSAKEVHDSFMSALGAIFSSVVSTKELIED